MQTGTSGANRANSSAQLNTSEAGQATSTGPPSCPESRKLFTRAIICSVLPRPISSARMPPKPSEARRVSHWKPSI